jgi:hypothetical protein
MQECDRRVFARLDTQNVVLEDPWRGPIFLEVFDLWRVRNWSDSVRALFPNVGCRGLKRREFIALVSRSALQCGAFNGWNAIAGRNPPDEQLDPSTAARSCWRRSKSPSSHTFVDSTGSGT